jgi:hypothetical protein
VMVMTGGFAGIRFAAAVSWGVESQVIQMTLAEMHIDSHPSRSNKQEPRKDHMTDQLNHHFLSTIQRNNGASYFVLYNSC